MVIWNKSSEKPYREIVCAVKNRVMEFFQFISYILCESLSINKLKKGCGQNTVHSPLYAIIASLTENRYEKTGIPL